MSVATSVERVHLSDRQRVMLVAMVLSITPNPPPLGPSSQYLLRLALIILFSMKGST